ncbi:MAG TPA: alpha/beta fold hydrolase [Oxalicibacterium sp.]|nr:alpha/beta fold hydrolase [Oxalicibacterium sp.]
MPSIQVNDITIEYDTQGDPRGEPVLLIMGLGMQLVSWPESFCEGLARQGFYLIRFDNRDSGLSTKLTHLGKPNTTLAVLKLMFRMRLKAGYTLDDMATDAVGLLDALRIRRAHIVGVSMGGMIAQIVAGRHPERVLSLTSIMSTSGRQGLPGPTREARKVLFTKPPSADRIDDVVDHFVDALRVIGSRAYFAPDVLHQRIRSSVERSLDPIGTTRQLLAIGASADRVELLKQMRVPTLVIHGKEDPLVPIECGRDTARLVPGAVMQEIDGMGHDLPDALDPLITDLIGEHCRAASGMQHTEEKQP